MRTRMNRLIILIVLTCLALALLLPACGQPPPEPASSETLTVTPTTTLVPTPAPTATPTVSETEVNREDAFTDIVVKSDLIVYGSITGNRYETVAVGEGETAGWVAFTISSLSVEKVIKGEPDITEVLIRTEGGLIESPEGNVIQGSLGPSIGDKSLQGYHREDDNVYTLIHNGLFWVETIKEPKITTTIPLRDMIGRIIVVMQANDIPIALPPSEWPPLPREPVTLPKETTLPVPEPPK